MVGIPGIVIEDVTPKIYKMAETTVFTAGDIARIFISVYRKHPEVCTTEKLIELTHIAATGRSQNKE
jgi:hypothetical protein